MSIRKNKPLIINIAIFFPDSIKFRIHKPFPPRRAIKTILCFFNPLPGFHIPHIIMLICLYLIRARQHRNSSLIFPHYLVRSLNVFSQGAMCFGLWSVVDSVAQFRCYIVCLVYIFTIFFQKCSRE